MTQPEVLQARETVVRAARSLLDGTGEFFLTVRAIATCAHEIDPDMSDQELLGFVGIDSQTDHLAIGPVVEEWHPSLREEKRAAVKQFEESFRSDALRDAAILVSRYGRRAT